ncbi:MAG TPA: hypothetical protein VJ890_08695 [Vineibacter sp.]|nr:hypothetical protein [Vineibacter sp.]
MGEQNDNPEIEAVKHSPAIGWEQKKYIQEWWKIGISAITSVAIVALGFIIQSAITIQGAQLKRSEQILLEKQKIYHILGPSINILYVYVDDVGDFAKYDPPGIIKIKRETDRLFFVYRPYWNPSTTQMLYAKFMDSAFETYTDPAKDAKIRADFGEKKIAAGSAWREEWEKDMFSKAGRDRNIRNTFMKLIEEFLNDIASGEIHVR